MAEVSELAARIGSSKVVTDPGVTAGYARDRADWAPVGDPLALVRAESVDDVVEVVRWCLEHDVPLVPRGAGTGLSGGANAVEGCVVLSMERLDRVLRVDPDEMLAVVQPGVINAALRAAVAEHGLWYPPDPSSAAISSIGGNVSTNAGGLCCVKYGVTADYVLGLQMVTGTGELVRLGRSTAKGVAGYNLCQLVVGAEGTLGVVTEVTVRLRRLPAAESTVVGYFETLEAAARAVGAISAAGIEPSALELLDRQSLQAVDEWKHMGLSDVPAAALLLGRSDLPGEAGEHQTEQLLRFFEEAGATWSARSSSAEEAEAFFEARRLAYPALERLGDVLTEDVCVPRRAMPEVLTEIERIAERFDTRIATVAHAGDGNLHPLLLSPRGDEAARQRAELAFDAIVDAALAAGGTITGEHGVGLLKRDALVRELGEPVMALHRAVKQAMDPQGIFNPGKVFGPR